MTTPARAEGPLLAIDWHPAAQDRQHQGPGPGGKVIPDGVGVPAAASRRAALPEPAGEAEGMSRYYIVHLDRRHVPAVAGPFLTDGSAREYLQAVVIGPESSCAATAMTCCQ
jgi:hypothetical protein